jgi:bacterial/archaeal transporter family protein
MSKTLLSILAGLGGMLGWGTSDFLANQVSDKIGNVRAFFWSQIAGLILIVILTFILATPFATSPQLFIITILSGISYALGYLLFYKGFEVGNVSVVSAVVNLQNIFIIAIAYFIYGQRITFVQISALIIIMIGITLVSVDFSDFKKGKVSLLNGVKETLLSTIMFGVFYWPVNEYIVERTHWLSTTVITKLSALVFVFLLSVWKKDHLHITSKSKKLWLIVFAVGILEAIGVSSVSFGLSVGDSILVAPIASSLTIVTVGLAIIFLKEKISKIQGVGIMLTVLGIILTAF